VQRARVSDGRTVAQQVIDEISQVNADATPFGSIGAVIGATIGDTGHILTEINGPILAPGLGAQGATANDLRTVFGEDLHLVLPSFSREVLAGGPTIDGLRAAADAALASCRAVIAPNG
jgi:orotidine-5'-phosphate decarboxylase